jgi:hypothetical protein
MLVRRTLNSCVRKRRSVLFWWRPRILIFGCNQTLVINDMSFDRVAAREFFAAIRAQMHTFDSKDVNPLMTLEI